MRIVSLLNQTSVEIEKEWDSVIYEYFTRLNSGEFTAVSELFSVQGQLYPPFEKAIYGREAIDRYLQTEAREIESFPKSGTVQFDKDGYAFYQIIGTVKTNFFTVNVGWSIELNADKEIVVVEVKLLAELQDLLMLKRA